MEGFTGSTALLENLTDSVWLLDLDTLSFLFHNPAVERLTGYTPEEAVKIPLEQYLTPGSFKVLTARVFAALDRMRAGEAESIRVETKLIKKNGDGVWVESALTFIEDKDRRLVLGTSRDISERKAAEAEREDLIGRLRKVLAEKERLLKENKVLRGLLPICSNCNKIRDEKGIWHPLEEYIEARSKARFSHTICPDCTEKLYPGIMEPD